MPFLSISTYCPPKLLEQRANASSETALSRFKTPSKQLKKLKESYERSVIHESATLDESYYHFATDDDAQKDRRKRNETQVAAKVLNKPSRRGEPRGRAGQQDADESKPVQILRVNQIWIWAIADSTLHADSAFLPFAYIYIITRVVD